MKVKDRRETDEQRGWWMVVGTDSFMSGWGLAANGNSYAAWAAPEHLLGQVERWVRGRDEMKRVRVVRPDYRPGSCCAHLSIYVVDEDHPAVGGR